MPRRKNLVERRPAETGAVTIALATVGAYALGVRDEGVILAAAVVLGAVPSAITWLVELRRSRR